MDKKEIIEKLDALGVEYDGRSSAKKLQMLLDEHSSSEVEASSDITVDEAVLVEKSNGIVQFGALMKLNVLHDGIEYLKGEAVDLGDETTYDLFKQNGWIE